MSPLSWRATFWFCFAFALFIMSILILFFPETYRIDAKYDLELPTSNTKSDTSSSASSATLDQLPNAPENQSKKTEVEKSVTVEESANSDKTALAQKRRMNPIKPFLLLRHPFILLSAFISGIAFGCMFAVETIIPDLYETHYGFNSWQTGMYNMRRKSSQDLLTIFSRLELSWCWYW
jgi:hypothetical protein